MTALAKLIRTMEILILLSRLDTMLGEAEAAVPLDCLIGWVQVAGTDGRHRVYLQF